MVKDLTNLEEFTLENKTNEITAIRYYLVNFVEKLQPGDKITITPRSSEELAYYMKIQEDLEATNGNSAPSTPEDYIKIGINAINTELGHNYIFKEITSMETDIEFTVTSDGNEVNGDASFGEYDGKEALIISIHWAVARIDKAGNVLNVEEQQN